MITLSGMRRTALPTYLRLHHRDGGIVVSLFCGSGGVLDQEALETPIVRVPHCGVHADVRANAGEDQILHSRVSKDELQICAAALYVNCMLLQTFPRSVSASAPHQWHRRLPSPACQ